MMQNMNKITLVLFFIFTINISFSQNLTPKDILLKSKQECEKVKSASFDAEVFFKFFNNKDTTHLTGRLNLLKLDTNQSGVLGRMLKVFDKKEWTFFQFINHKVFCNSETKITIDTIYFKQAFEGNIHHELFNVSFMKQEPFGFLSETGNKYDFVDTSGSFYKIHVKLKDEDDLDNRNSIFCIDKRNLLPTVFTNTVRMKTQNQYQFRNITITNLSINDDSATYYLNHFNEKKFDTINYEERYVIPKLLDSSMLAPNWKFQVYGTKDSVSLSQFKGKYVLMDYWYVACYPCQKAVPALIKLQEKYKDKLIGLGMNPFDNDDKLEEFISKNKINYKIIKCNNQLARSVYKVSAYPTMYILDKEGKIIKAEHGFDTGEKGADNFVNKISELIKN